MNGAALATGSANIEMSSDTSRNISRLGPGHTVTAKQKHPGDCMGVLHFKIFKTLNKLGEV